jgi:iron complex outermembrane recepter protein
MKKYLLIAFLWVSFSVFTQNKNCSLIYSGQVIDQHDSTAVPFARIQIKELNLNITSDSLGLFKFPSICPGEYTIVCLHHVGCEPVKFKKGFTTNTFEKVYIEFHFDELDEVQVEYTVFKMSTLTVDKPTELEKNFAIGKTLGELVKQLPGVNTLNTGSNISKPIIHGMHSNRVLIMNNGIRQEGQQWGSEHAPEIDPFLYSEVSLIKGANAVRYGSDAIAGVILLEPTRLIYKPGLRGQIQTTLFTNGRQGSISSILEGGFKKFSNFSWRAQGTFKQGGTLQTPNYYLKNTSIKEYNFSLNAKYEVKKWGAEVFYSQFNTDLGIFSGSHIGNLTDLNNAFNASQPLELGFFSYTLDKPRQQINHDLFKTVLNFNLNSKNRLVFQYGRQQNLRKEYDRHTPYNDSIAALGLPAFQLTLITHSGDLKWEHQLLKKIKGEAGVSYQNQGNSYQGRFFVPNFRKNAVGIYLLEVLKLKSYEIEAGLRFDRTDLSVFIYESKILKNNKHQFQQFSGTTGISKTIGHHWILKFNMGTAWRPPSINELYSNGLHHGAAAIEIGDRSIKKEVAYNFQTGINYKTKRWSVQADVYHNQINGFVYLKPSLPPVLTIKGAFPVFRYEQIDARFSGVDLTLNFKFLKYFNGFVKGSIVRAYNQSNHSFLVGIPADKLEPGVAYSRQFRNNNVINVQFSAPMVRTQDRVESNSDYVSPPTGYVLVNGQVTYSFRVKNQKVDLSLEVSNLTNQVYRDYLNRFRYFADEVGRNIGFKLKIPFNI